jgi:hypothetical protein
MILRYPSALIVSALLVSIGCACDTAEPDHDRAPLAIALKTAKPFCREVAPNGVGYGEPFEVNGLRYKSSDEAEQGRTNPSRRCGVEPACSEAANGQGYGDVFFNQGAQYRKIDEQWHNKSGDNWCRFERQSPGGKKGQQLFTHKGKDLFLTGVNIGNVQFLPFSRAPYTHNEKELKQILVNAFKDLKDSGVNSIRFWLHIDGSENPEWSDKGPQALVSGLPPRLIEDLQWLLKTAYKDYGLLVNVTLWSHDILAVRRLNPIVNRERAIHMITTDKGTEAYIKNALTPMIQALKQPLTPQGKEDYLDAVLSWEVLNEPEGISWDWRLYHNYQYEMKYGEYCWKETLKDFLLAHNRAKYLGRCDSGWTPIKYEGWHFISSGGKDGAKEFNLYTMKDVIDDYPSEWDYLKEQIVDKKALFTRDINHRAVMKFINKVAGAIHRLDPEAKVSSGAHSMPYNTETPMELHGYPSPPVNFYSDSSLIAAGGDKDGYLDFYQVHGYPEWNDPVQDAKINMFLNPKDYWGLDKPLIVGEHWNEVEANKGYLKTHHYQYLYDHGYAGVWGWAYLYVKEFYDHPSKSWKRYIDKHVNQDYFRELFKSLPSTIKQRPF